jgi:predicted nucleotidyltransferase
MKKVSVLSEMLQLDNKIDGLAVLLEAVPDVQAVFLFGSYGTAQQTPLSDIDFAVYYNRPQTLRDEAALLSRLANALDTDRVDLVNLNNAPLALRFRVISEGRIIYERNPVATSDFIEGVIRDYQDFSITMIPFGRRILNSGEL